MGKSIAPEKRLTLDVFMITIHETINIFVRFALILFKWLFAFYMIKIRKKYNVRLI